MIKIASAVGFTTDEMDMLNAAVAAANVAIASDEFRLKVITCTTFMGTQDSPSEILSKLNFGTYLVNFSIQSYPWWKLGKRSEVAHENPDGGVVFNRRFFDYEYLAQHANTVAHETCHVAGYSHPYNRCYERDFSVPYQIGDMVEACVSVK